MRNIQEDSPGESSLKQPKETYYRNRVCNLFARHISNVISNKYRSCRVK